MGVRRKWPLEQIRAWVEDELRTHAWVAEQLGCASQTIGKLCAKWDIQCQRRGPRGGAGHPNWRGGRHIDKGGYVLVRAPGHPHANKRTGYVREHRLVMEKKLGRYLEPHEVVHHIDGNPANNAPENLELFDSNAEHLRHELRGRCPNWTEAGAARIRDAVSRSSAKRRKRPEPRAQG